MKTQFIAALTWTVMVTPGAQAWGQLSEDPYFVTGPAEISVVEELGEIASLPTASSLESADAQKDGIDIGTILIIGEKIWKVIEDNKPVVNVTSASSAALPQGISRWDQLQGWQTPVSKVFRVTYKNLYGITVCDFSYRVTYTYGGNYRGAGRYLAHVSVTPANLTVAWGYRFNAVAQVSSVINAGTERAPLAGMELLTSWKLDTVIKHQEQSTSYFVRGDGKFVDLSKN